MNEKEIKNYIDGNSLEFKHFKLYADSTLKNMTKDELISYIHVIYHNWKCADIEKERLHKIICDLTNNQPYKFEDLKVGMLVYDIKPEYEDFKIFKITKILTKEECLKTLDDIRYLNVAIFNETCGEEWFGEFEQTKEFKVFEKLIKEHFDNKPLKFEELEVMKPYWDNKEKEWCYFATLHNDLKTGVKITISSPPLMSAFKFEENMFYRKEVKK